MLIPMPRHQTVSTVPTVHILVPVTVALAVRVMVAVVQVAVEEAEGQEALAGQAAEEVVAAVPAIVVYQPVKVVVQRRDSVYDLWLNQPRGNRRSVNRQLCADRKYLHVTSTISLQPA